MGQRLVGLSRNFANARGSDCLLQQTGCPIDRVAGDSKEERGQLKFAAHLSQSEMGPFMVAISQFVRERSWMTGSFPSVFSATSANWN
jgi:hypothetical protein